MSAANFAALISSASEHDLGRTEGAATVDSLIDSVHRGWDLAADRARPSSVDRACLGGRQILNPAASYGLPTGT